MKAQITDRDALQAIAPAVFSAQARDLGWIRVGPFGEHADIYSGENLPEIIVPRTTDTGDYASVAKTLITVFADKEGKDQLQVYRDLVVGDNDVVRVRVFGAEDDGAIPLEAGVKIIAQSKEMLLAAACSVRSPQAAYRAGANREASDYMNRVKLGQTEHGSFVVTLLSPVAPLLQPALSPDWADINNEPIERKVTWRLMTALENSRRAIESVSAGEQGVFDRAVNGGVSANLCEAVAALVDQSGRLDISMTWAKTRPIPEKIRKVVFTRDDAEILREAARTLRLKVPRPDVTLYGSVVKLSRSDDEIDGSITLRALIDEKVQSVSASLDMNNYSIALNAHDKKTPVIVTGDLEQVGARWHLRNGSVTEITADEDNSA
jgi:hypothetical protein